MPKIVLKTGKIIEASEEQYQRLVLVVLLTTDFEKIIKLGRHTFQLNDIEDDPKKILDANQGKFFDIPPIPPKKNKNSKDLA